MKQRDIATWEFPITLEIDQNGLFTSWKPGFSESVFSSLTKSSYMVFKSISKPKIPSFNWTKMFILPLKETEYKIKTRSHSMILF